MALAMLYGKQCDVQKSASVAKHLVNPDIVVQDMTEEMVRDEGLLQTLLKALHDSLSEAVEDHGLNRMLNVEKISLLGVTRFSSCVDVPIHCL